MRNQIEFNVMNKGKLEHILSEDYNLSHRKLRQYFKEKAITVNGESHSRSYMVQPGDTITIIRPPESFDEKPIDLKLDVIYEDEHYLVINKKSGYPMLKGPTTGRETISAGVAYLFKTNGVQQKVRLVNRLDYETSGIVVVAKHDLAHSAMARYWDEAEKIYLLIVDGTISEAIECHLSILYDGNSHQYIVDEKGKLAHTSIIPVDSTEGHTLLKAKLHTGKTHQIRVHLSYLGHPLWGDEKYGGSNHCRVALHGWQLSIYHPFKKQSMNWTAPIPHDFKKLIHQGGFQAELLE